MCSDRHNNHGCGQKKPEGTAGVPKTRGAGCGVQGQQKSTKKKIIKQLNQKEKKKIAKYIKNTIKIQLKYKKNIN